MKLDDVDFDFVISYKLMQNKIIKQSNRKNQEKDRRKKVNRTNNNINISNYDRNGQYQTQQTQNFNKQRVKNQIQNRFDERQQKLIHNSIQREEIEYPVYQNSFQTDKIQIPRNIGEDQMTFHNRTSGKTNNQNIFRNSNQINNQNRQLSNDLLQRQMINSSNDQIIKQLRLSQFIKRPDKPPSKINKKYTYQNQIFMQVKQNKNDFQSLNMNKQMNTQIIHKNQAFKNIPFIKQNMFSNNYKFESQQQRWNQLNKYNLKCLMQKEQLEQQNSKELFKRQNFTQTLFTKYYNNNYNSLRRRHRGYQIYQLLNIAVEEFKTIKQNHQMAQSGNYSTPDLNVYNNEQGQFVVCLKPTLQTNKTMHFYKQQDHMKNMSVKQLIEAIHQSQQQSPRRYIPQNIRNPNNY